ncbi:SDR family NAD(P)-dependent oxidoreductase [Nisaea denitrificans]|uniref:SDR family NAD(P)-dependent oxidoreductase n=1 Tax=Nisaea denitrificans TaxID=390877 RepID=UPI00041E12B1|nr:SDR family NAD(P)-dependent oxidoreductase [Nisaea denitrificans]
MTHPAFAEGNVAVITGAALGIGRAAALHFAEMGIKVCLVDLPSDDLVTATAEVIAKADDAANIIAVPTDVSDPDQIKKLEKAVREKFGGADILLNNAASRTGRGFDGDIEDWRHLVEVNLWGVIYGTRAFLPGMRDRGTPAVIVNTGSKQGITNPPGHPVYNLSKAAVKSFTESLAHELRSTGVENVTAHLLIPGWTTTGKNEHRPGAWLPEQVIERMLQGIEAGSFYIVCPDDEVSEEEDRRRILWGAADITEDRPALSRWDPTVEHAYHAFKP